MATPLKRHNVALASVGIDIGKGIFYHVGFDPNGKIVLRRKIRRLALVSELEKLPPNLFMNNGSIVIRMSLTPEVSWILYWLRQQEHPNNC